MTPLYGARPLEESDNMALRRLLGEKKKKCFLDGSKRGI